MKNGNSVATKTPTASSNAFGLKSVSGQLEAGIPASAFLIVEPLEIGALVPASRAIVFTPRGTGTLEVKRLKEATVAEENTIGLVVSTYVMEPYFEEMMGGVARDAD